jgi:hypothetical protein
MISHLRSSAKKRGIEFDLDVTDLNRLGFPISCPILGMPLKFNNGKPKDNSYSVDRIDSNIGYTPDNIVIISYKANRLKSDATLIELKRISNFYTELDNSLNL